MNLRVASLMLKETVGERLRRLETIFVDAQIYDLRLKSLSRNS